MFQDQVLETRNGWGGSYREQNCGHEVVELSADELIQEGGDGRRSCGPRRDGSCSARHQSLKQ